MSGHYYGAESLSDIRQDEARQDDDERRCGACGCAPCKYVCPCCSAPCDAGDGSGCCDIAADPFVGEAWECLTHGRSGE